MRIYLRNNPTVSNFIAIGFETTQSYAFCKRLPQTEEQQAQIDGISSSVLDLKGKRKLALVITAGRLGQTYEWETLNRKTKAKHECFRRYSRSSVTSIS